MNNLAVVGIILGGLLAMFIGAGIRVIRPTHRGLVETFGKFTGFKEPGLCFVIPLIQRLERVNITERMMDVQSFEAITQERLNTQIDLVVFYKVKNDEKSIKSSVYAVDDFERQVVRIAQTTARNVIGKMSFEKVNSERNLLNTSLKKTLEIESESWGVEIVRVETKEITPPKEVQDSMNEVLMAENKKTSAINLATATETQADGAKRAKIKEAEGEKTAKILRAEGEAKYNELVSKSFKGKEIQLFKTLETIQTSLKDNAKIVITDKGISPQIILGDLPFKMKTVK